MRGYVSLLRELFSYDEYAERAISYLTAIRKFEPLQPKRHSKNELRMIWRFLLFVLFGGDAERRRFSRKVLWATLREKPSRLAEALYIIVVHKHFHGFVAKCVENIEDVVAGEEPESRSDMPLLETAN